MKENTLNLSEYQRACLDLMGITPMVLRESAPAPGNSVSAPDDSVSVDKPEPAAKPANAAAKATDAIAMLRQAAGDSGPSATQSDVVNSQPAAEKRQAEPVEADAVEAAAVDITGKVLFQVSDILKQSRWLEDLQRALALNEQDIHWASSETADTFSGQTLSMVEDTEFSAGDGRISVPQQLSSADKRALWQYLCQSSLLP